MAKSEKSILESSDKDVNSSKEYCKGIETEPRNILSEGTEKSASKVPPFKCDQCSLQGNSYKRVKHHTRLKQKKQQLDD